MDHRNTDALADDQAEEIARLKRGIKDQSIAWDSNPAENQRLRAQLAEALAVVKRALEDEPVGREWMAMARAIVAKQGSKS